MTPHSLKPTVWVNGRFIPEDQAVVSIFDRSFQYGDGLFETIRIHHSVPMHWTPHLDRLRAGAEQLRIQIPFDPAAITAAAQTLVQEHAVQEAILRLTLSRGVGRRGYSPRGANQPMLVMTLHPLSESERTPPAGWNLATSRFRLPARDLLSRFKTANKLIQVLARAEAEDSGADEALLLDSGGHLAETTSGNLFWIEDGVVCTPPLSTGALAGVTRDAVIQLCARLGLDSGELISEADRLKSADGVFVTLSSWGIVPVARLDGLDLPSSPVTDRIRKAYWEAAGGSGTP